MSNMLMCTKLCGIHTCAPNYIECLEHLVTSVALKLVAV